MSYIFEGKVANQSPRRNMSGKSLCSKCSKLIPEPETNVVETKKGIFLIYNYIKQEYFIYESRSGHSVVYCSDYCMKKHNHRFK